MNTTDVQVACEQCGQSFSPASPDRSVTCPHCGTAFQLAPEDLAAVRGWDRPAIHQLAADFAGEREAAEAAGADTSQLETEQLDRVVLKIASLPTDERERIALEFDEETDALGREEEDRGSASAGGRLGLLLLVLVLVLVLAWLLSTLWRS